jgi:hypothetical protein
LARAVRRGLSNMKIQAYLTAAAINLKRLAAAFFALLVCCSDRGISRMAQPCRGVSRCGVLASHSPAAA